MEPTNPRPLYRCPHCLGYDTTTLLALRDALQVLSLALKDLLFELDTSRRASVERSVQRLLQDIAGLPRP